jgi:hypothetical protein
MNALDRLSDGFLLLAGAPAWALVLTKVTLLLAAAWIVHFALARVNPRWRILLWRATGVALLAIPLLALGLPAIEFHVARPQPKVAQAERPDETAVCRQTFLDK